MKATATMNVHLREIPNPIKVSGTHWYPNTKEEYFTVALNLGGMVITLFLTKEEKENLPEIFANAKYDVEGETSNGNGE